MREQKLKDKLDLHYITFITMPIILMKQVKMLEVKL